LTGREIGTCILVCKQWYQMLNNEDNVWFSFLSDHFPAMSRGIAGNFKDSYHALYTLYSNFTKGVYASHTLQGHQDAVTCLTIAGGIIVSGSCDKTIKIWYLNTV